MKNAFIIAGAAALLLAILVSTGHLTSGQGAIAFIVASVVISIMAVLQAQSPAREPQVIAPPPVVLGEVLSSIVTALPDPSLIVSQNGVILCWNADANTVFSGLVKGSPLSASVRSPVLLDALQSVSTSQEIVRVDYEQRVPLERRFEVFMAPLGAASDEGTPAELRGSILITLRDLTRQEKVERMRADFVANASHELRTPLAAVLGFIETLQGAAKEDEAARGKFLDMMQLQANRMKRLIEDLLSLNRIELNVHVRPTATVDVARVMRHVVEYLTPLADDAGVAIQNLSTQDELFVQGDWDELVQVCQNLIENAVKYGATGERIEVAAKGAVSSEEGAPLVEICVRDFGPGIPEQHLPRLTERFYRVDVGESRAKGGTGLGLAIVKHIVNRHRGRLVVDSTMGEGSTFTVQLPREAAQALQKTGT